MPRIRFELDPSLLFRRKEFKAVRIVGYTGSCPSHDPQDTGRVRPWSTTDQYLLPASCTTRRMYDDELARATRMANEAHHHTGCKTALVVTLNAS